MTIETFIHTSEGVLKPDLPWYLIEGSKAEVIDAKGLVLDGVPDLKNGDLVRITEDAIANTKHSIEYAKRRGRGASKSIYFVRDGVDLDFVWCGSLTHLKPIET